MEASKEDPWRQGSTIISGWKNVAPWRCQSLCGIGKHDTTRKSWAEAHGRCLQRRRELSAQPAKQEPVGAAAQSDPIKHLQVTTEVAASNRSILEASHTVQMVQRCHPYVFEATCVRFGVSSPQKQSRPSPSSGAAVTSPTCSPNQLSQSKLS